MSVTRKVVLRLLMYVFAMTMFMGCGGERESGTYQGCGSGHEKAAGEQRIR